MIATADSGNMYRMGFPRTPARVECDTSPGALSCPSGGLLIGPPPNRAWPGTSELETPLRCCRPCSRRCIEPWPIPPTASLPLPLGKWAFLSEAMVTQACAWKPTPLLVSLPPPNRVIMSLRERSGSRQHGENNETFAVYLDDLSLTDPVDEENHHAPTPQRHNKPQGDEGNSQPMKAHVSVVDYVCPAGKRARRLWPLPVRTR